jgi:hypothetical protein
MCCLVCLRGALAAADEPAFRYSRDLALPDRQQEDLVAVTLDPDVFAATGDGFPDVRILDADDQPVSFLVRKAAATEPQTVRKTWTAANTTARPLDDGGLEITVELREDDPAPNGLRLISPLRNFEHRVRVFTSGDAAQWEQAGEETVVFDYSRYMDVRSDGVPFPETPRRHFRIVIDDVTSEQESELLDLTVRLRGEQEAERVERVTIDRRPFRVERVEFWRETHQERVTGDRKAPYPISELRVEEDQEGRRTLVFIESRREPLTSLELVTTNRNFSRRAAVEVEETRGVTSAWREIGAETVARIDFKDLKRERLAIPFPESRQGRYRIAIQDRDSRPLEITGVRAEGNVYEVLFLAAPEQRYRLVYGADDAASPHYDTAAITALLREGFQPTHGDLGKEEQGPGAGQTGFRWTRLAGDGRVLVGVIVVLVVALGWGLYHAGRRVDAMSQDGE